MKKGASVLALLAGACWGMTGVFFRQLTDYFSQMEIVFIKMLVASLVLGIIILVKDPKLFRVKLKDLWVFLILGIVAMLLFNFFYFETMMHTSVAVAVSLLYTGPAFVILVSALLFKEKITMQKIFALVLIICGCACASGILVGEQYLTMIGLCFGVGSGFCYGMYTIGTRMAMDRGYQSYTIAFYAMFICLITSIPFADMGHIVANICPHSVIMPFGVYLPFALSAVLRFHALAGTGQSGDAGGFGTHCGGAHQYFHSERACGHHRGVGHRPYRWRHHSGERQTEKEYGIKNKTALSFDEGAVSLLYRCCFAGVPSFFGGSAS